MPMLDAPDADLPFCGVPNHLGASPNGRPCRWPHRRITWRQEIALPGLTPEQVQRGFGEAIFPWMAYAEIDLPWIASGAVNVLARAATIDGPDNVLADSQLPCGLPESFQLAQRFDDRDVWTYDKFVKTARHEFGHALGLSHTNQRGNIMFPSLDLSVPILGPTDIAEIQARYGERTTPIVPGPQPQPQPPMPTPNPSAVITGTVYFDGVPYEVARIDSGKPVGEVYDQVRYRGRSYFLAKKA